MQSAYPIPDDTPAPILSKTPFHMNKGWDLFLENTNTTCSHAEIDTLIQKRIINLIDLELIKTLARFPYTNIYNLSFYLNNSYTLHKNYHKKSYLDNLNKLKKAGIVARYCFARKPDESLENLVKVKSPLRLYSLTPPALSYIAPLLPTSQPLPISSDTLRKLEIAALNQFLIHFQIAYSEHIKQIDYLKTALNGPSPFVIDAIIQYQPNNTAFHIADTISLVLLSIRETDSWITRTVRRMKLLHSYISRKSDRYRLPFYLILAENIAMIVDLYPHLQNSSLSGIPFYFSLDTISSVYPPLECIYSCQQSEEDFSITAVRNKITI